MYIYSMKASVLGLRSSVLWYNYVAHTDSINGNADNAPQFHQSILQLRRQDSYELACDPEQGLEGLQYRHDREPLPVSTAKWGLDSSLGSPFTFLLTSLPPSLLLSLPPQIPSPSNTIHTPSLCVVSGELTSIRTEV